MRRTMAMAARWRNWIGHSLVNRLILFALLMSAALTLLVGTISYVAMQSMIREQVAFVMDHQASLVAQRMQGALDAYVKDIGDMSRNSFVANGLVDSAGREVYLRPFLRDHRMPFGQDIDIVLADFKGEPLAGNRPLDLAQFAKLPGTLRALSSSRPQAEVSMVNGKPFVTIFQPVIFPPTGQSEGALIARLDLAQLFAANDIASDHRYVTKFELGGASVSSFGATRMDDRLETRKTLQLSGPLGELDAVLTLAQDRRAAFAALDTLIAGHVAIAVLILALSFFIARRAAHRLAQPLVSLADAAGRIAAGGELALDMKVDGRDEVGRLGRAFEAMLQKLAASYASLEARVEARTQDLSRINASLNAEIAEREKAERDLVEARNVAEAASRAKSEFVANMSHELRTPMNAVLGMTELLGQTPLSADQRRYVEMVSTSGRSLLGILNDILDFSKIEAGRMDLAPAQFDLDEVLRTLATIMSANATGKELELAIGIAPGVPRLLVGDALRLQQVLVNIACNAIKFTERGEVSVMAECAAHDGGMAELRFTVRDSGIGMDEEQLANLFSPFTQADSSMTRRFGGTGLGLVISRRLVDLMDGSIVVQSSPGQGSTFVVTVRLPVAPSQLNSASPQRTVLVIDDNATSSECLHMTAASLGWQADTACNGEEAIELVGKRREEGKRYDAVLYGWRPPAVDSAHTMQTIRALMPGPHLPFIAMVNASMRDKWMAGLAMPQADAVLIKPVSGKALYDAVQEQLTARARRGRDGGQGDLVPVAQAQASAQVQPSRQQRLAGARLLLVEDNEMNQIVARRMLETAGATVELACNGQEAVDLLRGNPQRCDLVLMDVQMPVLDGFSATRLLRNELHLTLPIVAITAGVMESERDRCIASGMDDFIPKPVVMEQMIATIERHLKRTPPQSLQPTPASGNGVYAASVAGNGVFDVSDMMTMAAGDAEFKRMALASICGLIEGAPREMAKSRQAWDAGRAEEAARLLHALRGSVGVLGAKRFTAATTELEVAIRNGDAARTEELFGVAEEELEATVSSCQNFLLREQAAGTNETD